MTVGLDRLGRFEVVASDGLAGWLAEVDASLVFGRHNEVVVVGRSADGDLRVDTVPAGAVSAIAVGNGPAGGGRAGSVWMATVADLVRFEDGLAPGTTTDAGEDAVLLPQVRTTVGGTGVADLALLPGGGEPLLASHRFSCLARPADGLSFRPVWLPRWVTAVAGDERSPLSGVAVGDDGLPAYVSLLGSTDEPGGWRSSRASAGAIVALADDEVAAAGLGMPCSARWRDDRLWFCQAGTGELCVMDPDGTVTAVVGLPTFLRGLALVGDRWAVVAGSGSRSDDWLDGLPVGASLAARGERPAQGLWVIDRATGEVAHRLAIEGTGREIHAVAALPGVRRPLLYGPNANELQDLVAYDTDWSPRG